MFKWQNVMRFVNAETLLQEHQKQNRRKATGIDNVTKDEYDVDITRNITDLLERMKLFRYRPLPVRRTYIPKANGKLRPLGIPAYEDKLVQGAMANILSDIYEGIFLDCSYGFRPGRSCRDVVREINHTVMTKKVNYVLEADIKGFFDNLDQKWLVKFLEHDIADKNLY
jgi:retron-type reverse transcriptase